MQARIIRAQKTGSDYSRLPKAKHPNCLKTAVRVFCTLLRLKTQAATIYITDEAFRRIKCLQLYLRLYNQLPNRQAFGRGPGRQPSSS